MTLESTAQEGSVAGRAPDLRLAISRLLGALAVVALALAIAALSLPGLLVAAGGAAAAAAILFWPLGVLYLLLISVPFGSLAQIDAGDFAISATEWLVAALVASWLLAAAARRSIRLEGGLMLVPLVWVLAVMLLGLADAPRLSLAVKETVKWLELIVVFLFVAVHVRTSIHVQRVLGVVLAAGAAQALYGLYQFVAGTGPESFAVAEGVRAYGTFQQPNPFGGYLATLLPLSAVQAVTLRHPGWRALALVGMVVVGAGVLASQSRGAWLGLAVAAVVVVVFWSARSRQLLVPLAYAAVVAVVLGLLGALPNAIVSRVGVVVGHLGVFDVRGVEPTPENWAVVERMAHWQAGWYMFRDHPILGVGAGNYPAAYEDYFLGIWVEPLGHAHNYYINAAAELGLLGLAGVLALLALAFARVGRVIRGPLPQREALFWRVLGVGLLASLAVFGVHNVFDNLLVHGMSVQFGLILGLIYVAWAAARGRDERARQQ